MVTTSTGNLNTAIGSGSLYSNTIGAQNTAIGRNALLNNTIGVNNLALGTASGADTLLNITTASNQVVIGNNSTTNATVKVAWTIVSDARDKTDIKQIPLGLDFVSQLNPIQFQYRKSRDTEEVEESSRPRYGFIAQDILSIEGDHPIIIDDSDSDKLKYNESSLIPVLVKAIQELTEKVANLEQELSQKN